MTIEGFRQTDSPDIGAIMTINSLGALPPEPVSLAALAPQQTAPHVQNRALSQAVRVVNESPLTPQDRQLSLSLDPLTKMAVAKVVDPASGQVLSQVPSEDVLRLAAYLEAESAQEQAAQETHG